jgi:hypothetical protein
MKHKHTIFLVLIGWLFAAFFPPQALLGVVKKKV